MALACPKSAAMRITSIAIGVGAAAAVAYALRRRWFNRLKILPPLSIRQNSEHFNVRLAPVNVPLALAMSPGKINNASTAKRLWRKARIARFAVRLAGTRVPRIAFIITGSRGDYQAYIPVAKLLVERGIRVQIWCMGEMNADFVRKLGIDARACNAPVGDELFKRDPQICEAMEKGDEILYMRAIGAIFTKHTPAIAESLIEFHDTFQPDVLVYHPLMMALACDLHDVFGLPCILGALFPRTPSAHLAPLYYSRSGDDAPGSPSRSDKQKAADNLALHKKVLSEMFSGALGPEHAAARSEAGLTPLTIDRIWDMFFDPKQPTVCGWSPVVAPTLPDWPSSVHVTGYWTMDIADQLASFQPTDELKAFLAAGSKPVYLGWGSMVAGSAEKMATFAVEAAKVAGVRAVVLGGWAALSSESLPAKGGLREYAKANVLFYAGSLPHEWLFPQCAAAVHHGGAGTVAAVLRAGVPSIVTPVFIDQFYWARRVNIQKVGYGFSEPLLSIKGTELGEAIKRCVNSDEIKATAARLGKDLVNSTSGQLNAADIITEVARQRMLALMDAKHPSVAGEDYVQPSTPAPLKRGHSLRGSYAAADFYPVD